MEALRTPNECFENLARYPFSPKYAIVDTDHELRMHYVDVGRRDAPVVLMLHGEPTWSYLYRHMIQMLAEAGYRVVAPDLIGFGRSDKPTQQSDYSYAAHVAWVSELIDQLKLEDIVMVCHDWGGLIGLRMVAARPELYARLVASNTFLPTGDEKMPDAFFQWRDLSQKVVDLDVGMVIQGGSLSRLPQTVLDAYRAPFPDESYKAGVRSFPMLVPTSPDAPGAVENRLAWESLAAFNKPTLMAFSDSDPITAGIDRVMHGRIAGARAVEPVVIRGASHFLQEDRGSELAQAILDFLAEHPLASKKKVAAATSEASPTDGPATAPTDGQMPDAALADALGEEMAAAGDAGVASDDTADSTPEDAGSSSEPT